MNRLFWLFCIATFVLSGCSINHQLPIKQHYTIERAVEEGYVVSSFGRLANIDKLEQFVEKANLNENAEVKIAQFTNEGDPIFITLKVEQNKIIYTYDASLDTYSGPVKVEQHTCRSIQKRMKVKGASYQLKDCQTIGDVEVLYTPVSNPNERP